MTIDAPLPTRPRCLILPLRCLVLAASVLVAGLADAQDTTPPSLGIAHTWIEKVGTQHAFKLLLDPQDETGIDKVQHRFKINSTAPVPDTTAWTDFSWQRGTPLDIRQTCKSIVIELRALDVAGNASPIQRRTFVSPFPLGTAPNLIPRFHAERLFPGSPAIDCRGLFGADFDGDGDDDIMQIDRGTGVIKVRRQNADFTYSSNGFNVAVNAVSDSAIGDFDGDGRPDVALVLNGALVVYHNDGPDGSNVLQFSLMNVGGLATTGISTVVGVAAGDVTSEGKADLVITGSGDDGAMGTVAKIAVLIHNDQFQLGASNNAFAYAASSAGMVRLGDVTGDGWADAVMVDAANNRVLTFVNKANGSFGGASDPDTNARPISTTVGRGAGQVAQAIAVGDITGDGRADLVATFHDYGDVYVPGEPRNYLSWQLLDSRGAVPFHNGGFFDGGLGPIAASASAFRSDIMIQDLSGDRFPEVVVASPFAVNESSGVRAWRITSQLDSANQLTFTFPGPESFFYETDSVSPHRLGTGRAFGSSFRHVLLASEDTAEQVQVIFSSYTPSTKTYDLLVGATTDSDTNGTASPNGIYTYDAYVGGLITYSLSYVNNSSAAITGGVVECLYPSTFTLENGDAGYTEAVSGSNRIIRWTQDMPAGSSGVKTFSVRVMGGNINSVPSVRATFKSGTKTLAFKTMPKVYLREPLRVTMEVDTTSDPSGNSAHIGESIYYRYTIENQASGPVNNFKLAMKVPTAQTSLIGATSPPQPVLAGTFPNYSEITFTNLSLAGGAELERYVRLEVKSSVASGTVINNTAATVTRSDGKKVLGPVASVSIDPPLELTLEANKTSVQPGDTIRYTFKAKNWLNSNFTGAKVVNQLPLGTSLFSAGANDAVDSGVGGRGNFRYSAGTWTAAQLSPSSIPAYDRSTKIMTWNFDVLPAGAERTIEFDVIVGRDVPTTFNFLGTPYPLKVHNTGFNLIGTTTGGVRIFAGKPIGGTAANNPAATPDKLLTYYLTESHSHTELSDPPLTPPNLMLAKSALGDGYINKAGGPFTTVINDPSVIADGYCGYKLTAANLAAPAAIGRGVVIRDYVPKDMTFIGHLERNGTTVSSFLGYRFYDPQGKEMPVIGSETYTDTSGNGFWDFGEPYTDANNNKKYDGPIAVQVRSMDIPVGDMAGGTAVSFVYTARTTSAPGKIIISEAGGMSDVENGLSFTPVPGFHLTSDDLHFPVNGNPKQVKVLVTGPATVALPSEITKSRYEMVGTEITQIVIPFEVLNSSALTLSGGKMTVSIPKGYLVTDAFVQDTTTPTPLSRAGTTTKNSAGVTTVSLPINDWRGGVGSFRVQLDPATKSVLKGPNGQIKSPLVITPTFTSGYLKSGKLTALGSLTRTLGSLPVRDNVTAPPTPSARSAQAAPASAQADAKIFVGRCAPISVKRGETFGITIFVGNLTDLLLGNGTIEMKIPAGCDFVSSTGYKFNALGSESEVFGQLDAAKPVKGKITWGVGSFLRHEGGAVTLRLKVREDFSGTRIDDNTCIFDVTNASGKTPGPLGIVVRAANETTQASEIIQSAASGLGLDASSGIVSSLLSGASAGAGCTISSGGADLLQLYNGTIVIQLGGGRVLTAGPPDKILASTSRLVKDDAMIRVAVGPGDSSGVRLTKLPTMVEGIVQPANTLLGNLHLNATSMVAAGGGNLVAAGGGNMVAAGAGNLIGNDGSTLTGPNGARLIGNDGSTFTAISTLVGNDGASLIGNDGSTMVAAGGLNMVAAGGGNMVAAGAGNLIGNDGSTISPLVAAGAGNLIGQDGGTMVAAGGGNLVAAGGGNLVAAGGGNLIPNPK